MMPSQGNVSDALDYAIAELVPRECEEGPRWRIVLRSDGREDRSRHKQWGCYKRLATAVGLLEAPGVTRAQALDQLQATLSTSRSHTQFITTLPPVSDTIALAVLGVSSATRGC